MAFQYFPSGHAWSPEGKGKLFITQKVDRIMIPNDSNPHVWWSPPLTHHLLRPFHSRRRWMWTSLFWRRSWSVVLGILNHPFVWAYVFWAHSQLGNKETTDFGPGSEAMKNTRGYLVIWVLNYLTFTGEWMWATAIWWPFFLNLSSF